MNLSEIILKGENKTIEFKEELPKNESIIRSIIAFSNTSGGKLIIGIRDDGIIKGIKEEDIFKVQDKISSTIFDSCYPNILAEIYTLNIEGKILLVIEIFRGNLLPYYLKKEGKLNGTYIRVGATNRKAGPDNILDLERQKRNISFDEEINYDIEFTTLDLSSLYEIFENSGKTLDENKLENLKLIKKENNKTYVTNALLIILGEFEHTMIKCAKFKGLTMDLFLDKKEYKGNIFSILENTQNFILNHINLRAEIKDLHRTDTYEIPIVAIREALINALIHRDYTNLGRDIKIGIYDDIVNIVSPGSFPHTITNDDIQNGRSEIRNRVLANVFKELNLIEQWGSGIKRIKNSCLKLSLKEPIIQEKGDFVDVEIFREVGITNKNSNSDRFRPIPTDYDRLRPLTTDSDRLRPNKSEYELSIIKYLKEHKTMSKKICLEFLKIKETKLKELLNKMIEDQIIIRLGNGRTTYYELF